MEHRERYGPREDGADHSPPALPLPDRIPPLGRAHRALASLDLGAFHEAAAEVPAHLDGSLGGVAGALLLYDLLLDAAGQFRRHPASRAERQEWLLALAEGERERRVGPVFRRLLRDVLPAPAAPHVRMHPLVSRARSFIDGHHAEDVSLARVAGVLGTTRSYLSTLFRRYCGVTLTEYVHRVRIRRAIALLRSSDQSLAEVAFHVGYRSYRHFHRSFRRLTGLAPKDWLRRAREGRRPPVPVLLPRRRQSRGESPLADVPFDH